LVVISVDTHGLGHQHGEVVYSDVHVLFLGGTLQLMSTDRACRDHGVRDLLGLPEPVSGNAVCEIRIFGLGELTSGPAAIGPSAATFHLVELDARDAPQYLSWFVEDPAVTPEETRVMVGELLIDLLVERYPAFVDESGKYLSHVYDFKREITQEFWVIGFPTLITVGTGDD
jgi:hypothetical protein